VHIYIPLADGTPYDAAQTICRVIATVVATQYPPLATVERSVGARERLRGRLDPAAVGGTGRGGCACRATAALARKPRVPAHVLVESYSVLTRLPPPHRAPADLVAAFLAERFVEAPLALSPRAHL
jgi:hypothetical protein